MLLIVKAQRIFQRLLGVNIKSIKKNNVEKRNAIWMGRSSISWNSRRKKSASTKTMERLDNKNK